MQLRLRTKLTLVMTGLVFLVVVVLSGVYFARLTGQVIQETNNRANELTQQVFAQAKRSLADAKQSGMKANSDAPEDRHDYVRQAFERNDGLTEAMQAPLGANPWIYDVMIVDKNGMVLASGDPQTPGSYVAPRPLFGRLASGNVIRQMKALYGPDPVFEVRYPFTMGGEPFGEVRVGISISLLRNEILPSLRNSAAIALVALLVSTGLAMVVSGATLAPLQEISTQLDRISAGQFDAPVAQATGFAGGADELGLVSKKISQVGQQLRGVHEIFSTMRENLNSVMAGLEDGLLLFTRDARAVMVSPAAEKFLGAPSGHFLGRRVTEIFPSGHPLRHALHIEGDELSETASEIELETNQGTKRVGVSVQAIQEDGEKMGAMVTLRDLDSIESINTQLQVSERLAALGRITAGVAHEVKNPLNSMRLWLENLKESLPSDADANSHQAVQVLDKEIDRLDAVVKRFLDFTRPMEVKLEQTQLSQLLGEVLDVARPQLQKANVEMKQSLPNDVPEVLVDRDLLKQAVLNLVLNAVEAMPGGGQIRLELSRRSEMAEITVGDTGKGIPLENRQKIFQLFFTTRPGGSGIGLASAFRIVQVLNGSIDFTSEVGRGTTFRIELPLAA
ncbi:MAG: PAS domain S-box protein [Acidobacteria bacterium]|nr:PAS domain S-box protein [Acidobacteriota bacterium]MBS1867286.1 PAS domain S-box protein [Acidobacteriota bacterium]